VGRRAEGNNTCFPQYGWHTDIAYSCNLSVTVCVVRSRYTSPSLRLEGHCIRSDICRSWSRVWKALWGHFKSSGA